MSRRQVELCAARLSPADAAHFTSLIGSAERAFNESVAIRLLAWQFYRDRVPPKATVSAAAADEPGR